MSQQEFISNFVAYKADENVRFSRGIPPRHTARNRMSNIVTRSMPNGLVLNDQTTDSQITVGGKNFVAPPATARDAKNSVPIVIPRTARVPNTRANLITIKSYNNRFRRQFFNPPQVSPLVKRQVSEEHFQLYDRPVLTIKPISKKVIDKELSSKKKFLL